MLFSINVFATKDNYTNIIPALEQMDFNISDACFTSVQGEPVLAAMCTADLENIQIVAALDSCAQDNGLIIHSLLTCEGLDIKTGYKAFTTDSEYPADLHTFVTPSQSKKSARHIMDTEIPVHISKDSEEFKSMMLNHTEYFLAVSEIPQYIWDDVIHPFIEEEEETIFLNFEHYDGSSLCSLRVNMNRKSKGEIMNILAEHDFDLADVTEEQMYRVQLNQDYVLPKSKFIKAIRALAAEGIFVQQFETDAYIFKGSELSNLVCKEPFRYFASAEAIGLTLVLENRKELKYELKAELLLDRAMLEFLTTGKIN